MKTHIIGFREMLSVAAMLCLLALLPLQSSAFEKPEVYPQLGHADRVQSVVYSPGGNYLLSASLDSTIRFWDLRTEREVRRLIGHKDGVRCATYSPDGKQVLSGGYDKTIRLWDVNSGIELQRFTGQYAVSLAVFSNEGRYILAAGLGDAVLWDSWTGAKVRQLKDDVMSIYYAAAFSPDGKHVATCGLEKDVRIWEIDTGNRVLALGQPNYVSSVAVSPGSSFLAVGNSDRSIGIWNRVTGERTQLLKSHTHGIGGITAISFSPDSKYLLSGGFDNVVRLWDIASGKTVKEFKDVDTAPSSVAFSPDGKTALFTGKFYTLSLYDLSSGRQIQSIKQKNIRIVSGAFSPDGKQLLSDDGDDSIIILDRTTGKEIRKIKAFTRALNSAVFSPDGRSILAGGGDDIIGTENDVAGVVRLWDRATGRKLQELKGHRWFVASVAFSPDGTSALSGGSDATIRLWSLATGKQQSAFMGHASGVTSLSFFPDGKQVVSGSEDGTVRVWAVASGKELVQLINFPNGEWVAITPEGYYNASPNGDKHLNVRVGPNVYGIENYRETFFRPDLVKLALGGGSLQGYRTLADVKQPPKVSIVQTPVTSATEEFKLTLKLEEQGGGVGDVRLFLNGSAVLLDSARSLKAVQKEGSGAFNRSYTLKLSPGSNSIRAVAFNADNSMQSNEAVHQVQASFAAIRKPTLHALVIGIQEFRNPKLQLTYAVADANLFAETLRTGASGLFEQVKVTLLTSRDATSRDAVVSALQRYQTINPDDLFILYIASHGTVDEGEYYLITSNVGALSTQRLNNDALSQTELKELVANIPSTKKLIVIDTCNAGQLGQAMQTALLTRGMSEDTAMKVLSRAVGSTILSASTSVQEALEGYQGHGLFTWALVQGLQGKADKGKSGYVRTTDLAAYVEDEVPNLAEKIFKRAQFPTVSISGQGFPVGRVR